MDRLDQFFGVHGQALRLRSDRLTLIASNIANAATPGYRARDFDLSAALGAQDASIGPARTRPGHLGGPAGTNGPRGGAPLLFRQPVQSSLDGNSVELATEQLQFAETAVRYRSTLGILSGRIQNLTAALKVE